MLDKFIDDILIPVVDEVLSKIKDKRKKEAKVEKTTVKKVRVHNCWDCRRTVNYNNKRGCFNKAYPPKESSEGLDCDEWI